MGSSRPPRPTQPRRPVTTNVPPPVRAVVLDSAAVPTRYAPAPPHVGPVQRLTGWLSVTGRARLRLAKAHAEPSASAPRAKLTRSLGELRALTGARAEKARDTTRDVLLFLAWTAIRSGAVEAAQRWLKDVDGVSPDLPERVALRWELLRGLAARRRHEAYLAEARQFLTDPLVRVDAHGGAIGEAIRVLYEDISPARCAEVLAGLPPALAQQPFVRAAVAVGLCPPSFASRDDAEAWAARADPDHLGYWKTMAADARLVRARAAEWSGDLERMDADCRHALEVKPGHVAAEYWLARARLRRPGGNPLEGLNAEALFALAQGERLRVQVQLHAEPTLASAKRLLPVVRGTHGTCDGPEAALNLQLLERALTSDRARDAKNLRACADLSAAVAKAVGIVPWLESNCALAEIRLDRDYLAAIQRLERPDVLTSPLARQLAHIARLLAGMPPSADTPTDEPSLSALHAALLALVGRGQPPTAGQTALTAMDAAAGHPLLAQFPTLGAAADVLRLVLRVIVSGDVPRDEVLASAPGETAPAWAHWLHARALLVDRSAAEAAGHLDALVVRNPSTAWFLEAWWRQYSHGGERLPASLASTPGLRPADSAEAAFRELGPLCESACTFEAAWLDGLNAARTALAAGQAFDALLKLRKMRTRLGDAGTIVARTWDAASRYWVGVASAHAAKRDAGKLLEGLTPGPMGVASRAQLALLALQRRNRQAAQRWLADLPDEFPAAVYARALWHARAAEPEEATRLLDVLASRFAGSPSAYVPAGRRLSAALAERAGRPDAERLHAEILRDWPGDAVAAARLGRIRLKRMYEGSGGEGAAGECRLEDLFATAAGPAPISPQWRGALQRLHELLTCPDAELGRQRESPAGGPAPEASKLPWIQLLAHRWLRAGKPGEALSLYAGNLFLISGGPAWYARAHLILLSWQLLQELALARGPDDARRSALATLSEELQVCGSRGGDGLVQRWQQLLARAAALADSAGAPLPPARWPELGPTPSEVLPDLWSADQDRRVRTATEIAPACTTDSSWTDAQRSVVRAIVAWTLANENAFLDEYAVLEPILGTIPIDGPALWLAAARIHFGRKNWKSLLESDLPDCVSDLSHPGVRLVIGLAYTRAAVEDAQRGDVRKAQQKVRQARSTLETLVSPVS